MFGFGDVHTAPTCTGRSWRASSSRSKRRPPDREEERVPITELRATGGGSRSDSIMQMTADIFDLPVYRPHTPETSVVGAAMDAAVGWAFTPTSRRRPST